ncbi:SOS response-associated peptidase family protein [Xanthobacter versatilis]|uniref:SOS response-associated peptidase family protein n=1 Tax=Xanthobacter autotrophicus (strain ATCC BAA-1158 / Py2) TaxID=78245 RepID=UPI00372AEFEF
MPNGWFAGDENRRLMFFAGFRRPWKGVRRVRDGMREFELFGFLTTSPNEVVKSIDLRARPAILTMPGEVDLWLTEPWDEAMHLQRPLPGTMLILVGPTEKPEVDRK